jgi:ADP-ribosyl-[dinitrogen reductase] hydrolase
MALGVTFETVDRDDPAVIDRAVGALLGLAVGDAIGTTLEFSARDQQPALSGQLAGALWGAASIPRHWRDRVALGDEIAQTARDLLAG